MYPHEFWTDEQTETLRAMWTAGAKAKAIAAAVGRTVNSVRNRASQIGLPKRIGGKNSKNPNAVRGGCRRKYHDCAKMLQPRKGNFDSSKAVVILCDYWRKRAA